MPETLRKYQNDLIGVSSLVLIYLVTHLPRLALIPIFTDEAIYLRWSQIMAYDASLRYMPLVDGKPPLFMWLTSMVMRLMPTIDPLLTGRLVAVSSGLLGVLGIYFTAHILFRNRWISVLSGLLYILVPFTFFYDRFGLADSLLAAIGIWSLGLSVLLVRTRRLDVAMILGGLIGFGLLTKSPAEFYYGFVPLGLVFLDWKRRQKVISDVLKLSLLFLVVVAISQLIFSVLRLFPLFYMITQKNLEFIVTPKEFLTHPFEHLISNIKTFIIWEWEYLSFPIALLAVYALVIPFRRFDLKRIYLVLVIVAEFVIMASFNKTIFPRYLLIFTPIIYLLLASVGFELKNSLALRKRWLPLLLALFLVMPLFADYKLLTDPPTAPIASGDSNQYINAWPAGYGVREIRRFLVEQSRKGKVFVGTEGTFGLMPYSLELYQKDYPDVIVKSYWPLSDKVPPELLQTAKAYPTYFIIYQRQTVPDGWNLRLIASYQQGNGPDYLRIYQIIPQR